jgi:peptide/nickel transport system permease protein
MGRYLARRLLQTVLVVLAVSALSYSFMYLSGDPAAIMAAPDWTRAQVEEFRHQMGFDRPWYVQYAEYLGNALRGDFGVSLRQNQPTLKLVLDRMPATLELAGSALFLSIIVGLPIGVISATRRNTAVDQTAMGFALVGQSVPGFWLGIMLIFLFAVQLRWLPVAGAGGFSNIVLPAVSLATFSIARNARIVRSSMLEVLGQDFVRTAHSKGLTPSVVILRHALRNALIPVVTLIGLECGALLGGAVIIETVFAWPGVGRLMVQAIAGKDFPLVQAGVTLLATTFVLINLLTDIAYTYIDPRVQLA